MMDFLRRWLRFAARVTLKRYKPFIIGITGSAGKTSTKIAVYTVLRNYSRTRLAGGNLNNEIGLPLAVLGDYTETGGWFFWLGVILKSFWGIFVPANYPRNLVLEYGADKPGDISYLLKIAKPKIAIITAVGKVPVHVEFYANPEAVASEKGKLVQSLGASDWAIVNYDDPYVLDMKTKTRAKVLTFGFGEGADLRIIGFENRIEDSKPAGISFKLEYRGRLVPIKITGILGKSHAYAAAAAALVGLVKDINLVQSAEALASYPGGKGRMKIVAGLKGSTIIDDSYNASPLSTQSAIKTLSDLPAERKIAVLGEMAELGKYSLESHEEVGRLAAALVDLLITVGPVGKIIAEAALRSGLTEKEVFSFETAEEAGLFLKPLIKEGDLILIKGSQIARTERAIPEIMAEPRLAKKLLVRQYGKWLK